MPTTSLDSDSFLDRSIAPLSPLYADFATVPGLFRRRSVNLIIGKTKIGRMRFALTQLNDYARPGESMFLRREVITPVQLGCIIGAQADQLLFDLRAMGLENLTRPGAFPVVGYRPSRADESGESLHPLKVPYEQLVCSNFCPEPPRFLLIENLQSLLPGGDSSRPKEVAEFMDRLQEFAQERDCTILGTVGTPKMLKGQGYGSLPERILGCIQWAEGADTLIGIDPLVASAKNGLTKDEAKRYRKVAVMPAGAQEFQLCGQFEQDGRLVLCDWPENKVWSVTGQPTLEARLAREREGRRFTAEEFYAWGMQEDLSDRTVRRWRAAAVGAGLLVQEGSGTATAYVKPRSN
jgi:hypothetical protein